MTKEITELEGFVLNKLLNDPDYLACPSQMERHFGKRHSPDGILRNCVSRVSIGRICDKFEGIGLLEHKMVRPCRRPDKTKHYRVKEGYDAFTDFARYVLQGRDHYHLGRQLLMSTNFAHLNLNRQFVLDTLLRRGVRLKVPSLDNSSRSESEFLEDLESTTIWSGKRLLEIPPLGSYPKILEKANSIQREINGDLDYHIMGAFESKGKKVINQEDIENFLNEVKKKPSIFWVMRCEDNQEGVSLSDSDWAAVEQLNPEVDFRKGSMDRMYLERYFDLYQEGRIVLPILSLIQISPSALKEFLFGNWMDPQFRTRSRGRVTDPIEGLMFRLVFSVADDIISDQSILDSNFAIADNVVFGRPEDAEGSSPALMIINLKDSRNLIFEGGFTTDIQFIALNDEDVVPCTTNKENSWIKTSLTGTLSPVTNNEPL